MKSRQDNNVTDHIALVYSKIETELSGLIWLGAVCEENQTGQRYDWSYRFVYTEIEIELSGLTWMGAVYDENYTRQQYDRLYKYGLHQKRYWTFVIDRTKYNMWKKLESTTSWSIVQVESMLKTILNYRDWSNWVPTLKKNR